MEIFKRFDLVVLPFPFTDQATNKRRPALIISKAGYQEDSGHVICVMITTAAGSSWASDTAITEWAAAGLPKPSFVRLKVFTLDARFVARRLGRLAEPDQAAVEKALAVATGFG